MKQKLLALLMVSVMVASAFGAIAISATKVSALTYPNPPTLTPSTTTPTSGQQYTLSGLLTDTAGNPMANAPINIWYRFPGDANWQFSNTVFTGADGKYSMTTTSSKTVSLRAVYCGNGCISSSVVTITVQSAQPTLTLSSTSYSPSAGQQYTLSGLLTDGAGNPLANKPIDIYYHFVGGNWQYSNTVKTGTDGKYSSTASSSKTVVLQTGYKVGGVNVASSNVVTITVQQQKVATMLGLGSTSYSPSAGQQYTLSGYLLDFAGNPLANKPVSIWYHFPGGAWQFSNTVYTGADGKYSSTTSSSKTIVLQAGFLGDSSYSASSSNVVTINVLGGATTLTIFGPDSYHQPHAGELFTIYGNLLDSSGKGVAGEPIEIWIKLPAPWYVDSDWHLWYIKTTNATGGYSYVTGTDAPYMYLQARFPGDTVRGYSASTSNEWYVPIW